MWNSWVYGSDFCPSWYLSLLKGCQCSYCCCFFKLRTQHILLASEVCDRESERGGLLMLMDVRLTNTDWHQEVVCTTGLPVHLPLACVWLREDIAWRGILTSQKAEKSSVRSSHQLVDPLSYFSFQPLLTSQKAEKSSVHSWRQLVDPLSYFSFQPLLTSQKAEKSSVTS